MVPAIYPNMCIQISYIQHSFWGDIQYERRMGLDFIISYSKNNMLFILLVKTHHFGWLKPIILATASPFASPSDSMAAWTSRIWTWAIAFVLLWI